MVDSSGTIVDNDDVSSSYNNVGFDSNDYLDNSHDTPLVIYICSTVYVFAWLIVILLWITRRTKNLEEDVITDHDNKQKAQQEGTTTATTANNDTNDGCAGGLQEDEEEQDTNEQQQQQQQQQVPESAPCKHILQTFGGDHSATTSCTQSSSSAIAAPHHSEPIHPEEDQRRVKQHSEPAKRMMELELPPIIHNTSNNNNNNPKSPPSVASTSRLRKLRPPTTTTNKVATTTTTSTNASSTLPLSSSTTTGSGAQADPFLSSRPLRSWDLMSSATMRFRHGHFSGKSVQRLVQQERAATTTTQETMFISEASSQSHDESRGARSRQSGGGPQPTKAAASPIATHVLESQTIPGEAEYYRQRYIQKSFPVVSRNSRNTSNSAPSVISRTSSGRSRMPHLTPSVLGPQDAADAFDPGVALPAAAAESVYLEDDDVKPEKSRSCWGLVAAAALWGQLLDLAEPDDEVQRIAGLATPATLGAIADPCFRLGLVAIISNFLDTDSMVAYVLVVLFVRITTEELSGAITDAESSLLHTSLQGITTTTTTTANNNGCDIAGKQVQLAVLLQLLIAVPLYIAWLFAMDPLVSWLIPENNRIGTLAAEYTAIIVIDYALQSASRTFMLLFRMTGQAARLELHVDLMAAALTIAALAVTASLSDQPSLTLFAWIQVIIGALKVATKVGIVLWKGWAQPYRKGLLQACCWRDDKLALGLFLGTSLPLLLGSLIEIREWEILVLFVRHLSGAEVATWALMGIVWEIFEASTEGLGEAAAVRVSLLLSENMPSEAQLLAHKSVFLGLISSLVVTGLFFLLGPNLSVALTKDETLQTLFNDLVGTTGLANISMSLSQVYWSLLGAQDRFGVASSSILLCRWLLTMPLAAVYIYGLSFDLAAVGSALAVGYMTACVLLAWRLLHSDWNLYAKLARDAEEHLRGEDLGLLDSDDEEEDEQDNDDEAEDDEDEDEDFDDDSSDSTGFG